MHIFRPATIAHQGVRLSRAVAKTLFSLVLVIFASSAEAKQPNIVFFLVDDLGWRDVGCYGSTFYDTPNIDRLASEGARFTDAYATCHVCSPTRASILTGQYPARLGLTDWLTGRRNFPFQRLLNVKTSQTLPEAVSTIPRELRANGYATAIFGKWHVGEEPNGPTAHGFDLHVPKGWNKGWPRAGYYHPFKFDDIPGKPGDYLTDRLTDEAVEWIEANREKPFYLHLSLFSVHDPIQGRPDLVEKYRKKLETLGETNKGPEFILEGNPDDPDPLTSQELSKLIEQPSHAHFGVLPNRTVKIKQHQDNIQFAAMVEAMDQSLGRVLTKLAELGLEEETIVIFFADNGGMSGMNVGNPSRRVGRDKLDVAFSTSNLPLRGAKGWLYEGGVRVPMIIKWPGHTTAGSVIEEAVISTDFYPTILEMAGQKGSTPDGKSLVPALNGEAFERGPLFWHFPHYSNHGMQSPAGAIREGDFKLIEYFENGTLQLFNLKEDIGEQVDLASTDPEKTKELHQKLQQWRASVDARMMSPNPEYDAAWTAKGRK